MVARQVQKQGAAVEVMNLRTFKLTPEEERGLILNCQRLSQVTKATITSHKDKTLFIEVDMGPLEGEALVKSLEILLVRVINLANSLRPSKKPRLVHSRR